MLWIGTALASTCFDEPTYTVDGEHVLVGFDTVRVTYDQAQDWADSLDEAWEALEHDGWRPPPGTDEHDLLVLVTDEGDPLVYEEACPDGTVMPVLSVPDRHDRVDALAVRQLHLASQTAYPEQAGWMREAAAEAVAFTVTADPAWVQPVHSATPLGQGAGEARFLHHVDQGPGLVAVWEGQDLDLLEQWATWLPTLVQSDVLEPPTPDLATGRLPLESGGQPLPRLDALAFATVQIQPTAAGEDHDDIRVRLDVDPDAAFVAWLLAERDGAWEIEAFDLADGEDQLVVPSLSATQGAWVVLGPTAGEDALWLLTATAEGEPPPSGGGSTTSAAFDQGCAVAVGPWWLAGLLLLRRRA